MTKRKRSSAGLRAKVALEAIREEVRQPNWPSNTAPRPTMINVWKKAATLNMATAFSRKAAATPPISQKAVARLHARIGQLVVERDFMLDASGRYCQFVACRL